MAMSRVRSVFSRWSRMEAILSSADDAALLSAFIEHRDSQAFELLVRRHGPMVLGVCRRILGHFQDAEDAFQATFLILAQQPARVHPRHMVGPYLHGIAYRTACHARSIARKRRTLETTVEDLPEPDILCRDEVSWRELKAVVDEEITHLPDHYRVVVVKCELQGRPRAEVAHELAIPEGTLSSRLAAARKLLAVRLKRRGLALACGVSGAWLPLQSLNAQLPDALARSVVEVVMASTFSQAVTAGFVSAKAYHLSQGVMNAMFFKKLTLATAGVLIVGLSLAGLATAVNLAHADAPKVANPNDVERPNVKPREGEQPRNPNAPRDGERPRNPNAPRDGERPRNSNASRDGERPRNPNAPRDGERPKLNPGEGERPGPAALGQLITLEGVISKDEVKRKRDDGSEVTVTTYTLTDSKGTKYPLPSARPGAEGEKPNQAVNLADFVGKKVTVTGRGFIVEFGNERTTQRNVRLLTLLKVEAK